MTCRYVFKNADTGETRSGMAGALFHAAKTVGIGTDPDGDLSPPWRRWECWKGNDCLWHYTDGTCLAGPRPSSAPAAEAPSSAPDETTLSLERHERDVLREALRRYVADAPTSADEATAVNLLDVLGEESPSPAPALPKLWKATVELYMDVKCYGEACDATGEILREHLRRNVPDSCLIDWQYAPDRSMPVEATAAEVAKLEEFAGE